MASSSERLIRRRTTCTVPGHGTGCLAVYEGPGFGNSYHSRATEERLAFEYEESAWGMDPKLVNRADWEEYVVERCGPIT